ncbi:MAG: DnaJ domain-containing protein [Acidobacteriota bacterium]
MENRRNYYRVLHVQPDAPAEIIRTSYRTLMQRLHMHPDLGGDHWNATVINEAFAILSDPAKRATYDRSLGQAPGGLRSAAREAEVHRANLELGASTAATCECPFCGTVHSAREAALPGSSCASCGSPLYAAVRVQREGSSQRALERIPRQMAVSYCLSWPTDRTFEGVTENVSISGMRFTSTLELAPGERVRIDCEFCSAVAVVRNSESADGAGGATWHSGVEFLTLHIKHPRGSLVSKDF